MNAKKLSKRLEKVASFVPTGAVVADIGSDHAYLPCYLVHNGIAKAAIAVEAVNLVAIYLILPIRYFGVYTLSQKPFEDEATEMLRGSRYAFVGGAPEYWDFWTLERVGKDATATLGYNYATYFGLSNTS